MKTEKSHRLDHVVYHLKRVGDMMHMVLEFYGRSYKTTNKDYKKIESFREQQWKIHFEFKAEELFFWALKNQINCGNEVLFQV